MTALRLRLECARELVGVEPAALALAAAPVVEQIIDNYLDNAISVGPVGSTVEVQVKHDAHISSVKVLDRGPGMSPAGLERAFDRFWQGRPDGSGSGLGLASPRGRERRPGPRRESGGGGLVASARFGAEWTPERRPAECRRERSAPPRQRRGSRDGGRI